MARNKLFIKSKKPKNYDSIFENYYSWELFVLYFYRGVKFNIKYNETEVYETKINNHKSNLNLTANEYYFDQKINMKFAVKSNVERYARNFLNYADENYIPTLWDVRIDTEKKFHYFQKVAIRWDEIMNISRTMNTFILFLHTYFIHKLYVYCKRFKHVSNIKIRKTIYNFMDLTLVTNITAEVLSTRVPRRKRKRILLRKPKINELQQQKIK